MEKINYRGFDIEISPDENAEDPRSWDNLGITACFHNNYTLGDKNNLHSDDFNSFEELHVYLQKKEKAICILPLRMYEHSGITISTLNCYPYNDRWDAGQIGFIYTTLEQLKKMGHDWKNMSKERLEQIKEWLLSEVKVYDDYVKGDAYSYFIKDIDSCCGYYGCDHEENNLLPTARRSIDRYIEEKENKTNKGNKLIAEFMGIESFKDMLSTIYNGKINVSKDVYAQAEYHSSWNWLMPAYRKAKDYMATLELSGNEQGFIFLESLTRSVVDVDIKSAYENLVSLLQWNHREKKWLIKDVICLIK